MENHFDKVRGVMAAADRRGCKTAAQLKHTKKKQKKKAGTLTRLNVPAACSTSTVYSVFAELAQFSATTSPHSQKYPHGAPVLQTTQKLLSWSLRRTTANRDDTIIGFRSGCWDYWSSSACADIVRMSLRAIARARITS